MMFVNEIVLIGENWAEVNQRLVMWRYDIEENGYRINRSKTEYIAYEYGKREWISDRWDDEIWD